MFYMLEENGYFGVIAHHKEKYYTIYQTSKGRDLWGRKLQKPLLKMAG